MNAVWFWGNSNTKVRITEKTHKRCTSVVDGRIMQVSCTKCGDVFDVADPRAPKTRAYPNRTNAEWEYLTPHCVSCKTEIEYMSRERHGKNAHGYVRKTRDQKSELREDGRYWECFSCGKMVLEGEIYNDRYRKRNNSPGTRCKDCYRAIHRANSQRYNRKRREILKKNKDNPGKGGGGGQKEVPELQEVPQCR